VARGHDVERGEARDHLRVVERHPEARTPAAVVAGDREPVEGGSAHHRRVVLDHDPERADAVIAPALGLVPVALAAQLGRDHGGEALRERGRDPVPGDQRQRVAVREAGAAGRTPAVATLMPTPPPMRRALELAATLARRAA
jgi:hypothetical protein